MKQYEQEFLYKTGGSRTAVTGLTERQKTILQAVIREYVATASPVASAGIVRRFRLPYSSATVRNELQALDDSGYLAQPHTSAGRVPTDKGYRFFINGLVSGDGLARREERVLAELRGTSDPAEFMKQSSRILAHLTHTLALSGFPAEELFYKSGLSDVMQEPEFSDTSLVQEFSALVDMIEEDIMRFFDLEELVEPKTFVGAENPIRRARHCGMIVFSSTTPFAKSGMVA